MIKIQDSLKIKNPDLYLDGIANYIFRVWGRKYIIKKALSMKVECKTDEYVRKYAKNNYTIAKRHYKFYRYLSKNNGAKIKEIMTAKPDSFKYIIDEFFRIIKPVDLIEIKDGDKVQSEFCKLIYGPKLFNYSGYRGNQLCIDAYKKIIVKNTHCPYCNDFPIDIVSITLPTKNKYVAQFDLDHFYAKSKYPILSISFYNLIPSCHPCNSQHKGSSEFTINTHINPFFESFNDIYKFKIPENEYAGVKVTEIIIDNISKIGDQTATDLKLHDRYKLRTDKVENILKTYRKHKSKLRTDPDTFKDLMLGTDNSSIPNLKTDILKYKNSKLFRDIIIDMGLDKHLDIN